MNGYHINTSGDAFRRFATSPENMRFAIDRSLLRFSHELARQMKADAPKATSLLTNSIKPDRFGQHHFKVGPHVAYAEDVEKGMPPNRFVDRVALRDWIKAKGLAEGQNLKAATFLIARKIERYGTEGQPFVAPLANNPHWLKRLQELLSRELNRAF